MKLWFSAAVSVLFAGPLEAQAFDCSKASTKVETAICGNAELRALDDALAKAYAEIKSMSSAGEQKMLVGSQKRWIVTREGCPQADAGLTTCVRDATSKRLRLLTGTPESGPGTGNRAMPLFVIQDGSEEAYDLDIQLLRFENPQARGEKMLNRITKQARDALILGPHGEDTGGATYAIVQDMSISFASPTFMSVNSSYWNDTGGAHGNGAVKNYNIDMESGKLMEISEFFSEEAAAQLSARCKTQVIAEKQQRLEGETYDPAADDFLKDEVIAEHIATLSRWSFTESKASVSFDAYAIGSYAEGQYECEFPMTDLKNMALDGAPLP